MAGFSPECEGFSLNSVYGSRIEDFLRILCQGAVVFAYSAKIKFPNSFENSEVRIYNAERNHHDTSTEIKILYLLPKAKHP
jgi:hypothetical protein